MKTCYVMRHVQALGGVKFTEGLSDMIVRDGKITVRLAYPNWYGHYKTKLVDQSIVVDDEQKQYIEQVIKKPFPR
jgi:hypothetical protein